MAFLAPLKFVWPGGALSTLVETAGAPSEIESRAGLLVVDSAVESRWGTALLWNMPRVVVEGGEQAKTPANLLLLWEAFHRAGLERDGAVCVAGGGSVCDLGAMAASTWMRGIRLELIPTTLLCMADACLGGKTALNLMGAKNQVGTFHPADRITVCGEFLKTLPRPELLSGKAEVLKTAVIGDRGILEPLLSEDYRSAAFRSLRIKGAIVKRDFHERDVRRLLNLGHTLGHALEMLLPVSHGAGVALGMPAAARMAGEEGFAGELEGIIRELGLPVKLPRPVEAEEVLPLVRRDKKTGEKGRTWVLPRGWERCELAVIPPDRERELLKEALGAARP